MNRKIVIFGTNVYVNHYLGFLPIVNLFDEVLDEGNEIHMPAIVAMELVWYRKVETDEKIKAARQGYIEAADKVMDITLDIALKAAEIRRKWSSETDKKLKHGDALIAASALINDATLYSNNDKAFLYIKKNFNLTYINPVKAGEFESFKKSIT
ncbi:PIN domain-containing protein [Planococcus lenghuensis]|uniref:PIN domain-containing protein n=1 Tax=Planococcus lenghuensis TaxID=2213202 RepID=A0A1Q2L121_9BACL|nr:PIN domain-containing protein [Planococcus lenghuensis]AQQ54106.1 hypothetical protein B0X71_13995 [Planococcus lenghuensis]